MSFLIAAFTDWNAWTWLNFPYYISVVRRLEKIRVEEAFMYHSIISVFDIYNKSPNFLSNLTEFYNVSGSYGWVSSFHHSWLAHDIFTAVFLIMSDLATFQAERDLWPFSLRACTSGPAVMKKHTKWCLHGRCCCGPVSGWTEGCLVCWLATPRRPECEGSSSWVWCNSW